MTNIKRKETTHREIYRQTRLPKNIRLRNSRSEKRYDRSYEELINYKTDFSTSFLRIIRQTN